MKPARRSPTLPAISQFLGIQAFTLIEMLVVMAIIGVLAGLLLPVLSSSREQGRRAKCMSNQNQIGQSIAVFCNNSKDYLPSWRNPGQETAKVRTDAGVDKMTFPGHQGPSRHTVIGYSFESNNIDVDLAPNQYNFEPSGLGLLIYMEALDDPGVFDCPSMGKTSTYFGISGANKGNEYVYDPGAWKKLNVKGEDIFKGDARALHHTPVDAAVPNSAQVTALLSSYSYRDTPFYHFSGTPQVLDSIKPATTVDFMSPVFKTRRTLIDRAILSDSFDYAQPDKADWFGEGKGMGEFHHGSGYNVLYGDGHVAWFEDEDNLISNWHDTDPSNPNWADPAHPGTDNLTISSPTSQKVWNLFDRAVGLDVK